MSDVCVRSLCQKFVSDHWKIVRAISRVSYQVAPDITICAIVDQTKKSLKADVLSLFVVGVQQYTSHLSIMHSLFLHGEFMSLIKITKRSGTKTVPWGFHL